MLEYKIHIYPTKEQELALEQTLDGCRWVYNYFLSIPKMSEAKQSQLFTRTSRIEERLNDPVCGLTTINEGLSRAYSNVRALDTRITPLSNEVFQTQVALREAGAIEFGESAN